MKNLKTLMGVALLLTLGARTVSAHEGMWIPSTLAKLVVGDMQDAGLQLDADDIYALNHSSLKDAIVHFGGGCTAEVISEDGLILTNHHCGYSQVQAHSSLENDYLKNGFWAMDRAGELSNPQLTATFVVRIEDVSAQMLDAGRNMDDTQREAAQALVAAKLEAQAVEGTDYDAEIKPFFYGNAYYMVVTQTFLDVRLVGAPPSSIGKFGGDTDNWMWPRHTGDFSLFRIYAGPDNRPAEYSGDNVPYQPKYSLPINMDGLAPGDFTMVFGFPGRTEQYLSSYAVEYLVNVQNPARIAMRKASLSVIDAAMETDDELRIKYAAKQSRISNAYKKWIGQNMGLERYDAVGQKRRGEARFVQAARSTKGHEGAALLPEEFEELYAQGQPYALSRDYLIEYFYYGPEILRYALNFKALIADRDSLERAGLWQEERDKRLKSLDGFFKDYDADTDKGIFAVQSPIFLAGAPEILQSQTLLEYAERHPNPRGLSEAVYSETVFDDRMALEALLAKSPKKIAKTLAEDPIYKIAEELITAYEELVRPGYAVFRAEEYALMGRYVKETMALFPDKKYWPDANSTLRLTYGAMEGSEPRDGLRYEPFTTLEGVVRKYIPGDKEFDLPQKLIELYDAKDYGPYATDGVMRVCFLGSNHTTGGNSGSPALNARGELVGLNFDRTWESTMSDVMFNGEICRNIMVDVKYVLFIIDKFAGAKHLVDEMNLVYSQAPSKANNKGAQGVDRGESPNTHPR